MVLKVIAALALGLLLSACTTLSSEASPDAQQEANLEPKVGWRQKAAPDIGTQLHMPWGKSKQSAVPEITNR